LKKIILLIAVFFAVTVVKGQGGYNYYEWGLGVGASYERGYTNITQQNNHIGFDGSVIYNFSPYMPIAAELQIGTLSGGGDLPSQDPFGRHYTNNYKAVLLHFDIQLGALIDYEGGGLLNFFKNFYGGSGLGFVFNNNSVQRYSIYDRNSRFQGSDRSVNVTFPIRAGYEIKFFDSYDQPSYAVDIGYVHSFVFGEGLDGYDANAKTFKNNSVNQYRQITLGFKYYFGRTVSFNKLVRDR
jgi:hypothetical protein